MENEPMPKLRDIIQEIIEEERESEVIVVRFTNEPANDIQRLKFLSEAVLSEGKTKQLSGGYSTRYDRRPENQGGDQLHIYGSHGQKWAYRFNGTRSEPRKYSLPTTNKIRDIVSQAFAIDRSQIQEMVVKDAGDERILLEVTFF